MRRLMFLLLLLLSPFAIACTQRDLYVPDSDCSSVYVVIPKTFVIYTNNETVVDVVVSNYDDKPGYFCVSWDPSSVVDGESRCYSVSPYSSVHLKLKVNPAYLPGRVFVRTTGGLYTVELRRPNLVEKIVGGISGSGDIASVLVLLSLMLFSLAVSFLM